MHGGRVSSRRQLAMLAVFVAVLVWSGIRPHDYFTWALDVAPALAGLAFILAYRRRFPLSDLTSLFILLEALILIVDGRYTYAENPLFAWLAEALVWSRNYYNRLSHFFQGCTPALEVREVLVRKSVLARPGWLPFIVICICLAISAGYEFIEWWVPPLGCRGLPGHPGQTLGHPVGHVHGALLGATSAMLFLTPAHDRSLARLLGSNQASS